MPRKPDRGEEGKVKKRWSLVGNWSREKRVVIQCGGGGVVLREKACQCRGAAQRRKKDRTTKRGREDKAMLPGELR